MSYFRWNTQENDSFLGCQEGVLQCGFERGNLCSPGDRPMQGWILLVAEKGTVRDSDGIPNVGETVRAVMDSGGWHCLQSIPNAFYLPMDGHREDDSSSVCHGDDFLAEGSKRNLDELDELLNEHFEVTAGSVIGPGRPGQVRYLKRIIGYTENLPDNRGPRFLLDCRSKHVDFLVQWTKKRGGKPAVTPGTKATGMGARDTLELLLVRWQAQQAQHCTCHQTGQTRCLPARRRCNTYQSQTS